MKDLQDDTASQNTQVIISSYFIYTHILNKKQTLQKGITDKNMDWRF